MYKVIVDKTIIAIVLSSLVLSFILISVVRPQFHKNKLLHSQSNTQYWVWQHRQLPLAIASDGMVIMQGEYRKSGENIQFTKKGLAPYSVKQTIPVRLLIRAYELPPMSELIRQIDYLRYNWELSGTTIDGIQLDYDSPADKLEQYHQYISQLSDHYGKNFISITGLSSWLADNIEALNQFSGSLDYIAIQFYQFYRPVPQAQQYLNRLVQLKLPYKIGITKAPEFRQLRFPSSIYYTGNMIFPHQKDFE